MILNRFLLLLPLLPFCFMKIVQSGKSYDPGSCTSSNRGKISLVKDRQSNEKLLVCSKEGGAYSWKAIDGSIIPGEYFNPAYDCSDILNKDADAKDGFYWIKFGGSQPKKVWCDMTTDGGGYMLIGRKRNASTWSVPSSNEVVEPLGSPHWSSAFGDAPVLDFRVQMATKESFGNTKAHWSFRLKPKRQLKNLMMINQGGCGRKSAGIGNIDYVKDLLTENIVTRNLRCSKFGLGHHPRTGFGWAMMNSCLQKPCRWGFAFLDKIPIQTDYSGAFSYSVTGKVSGIDYDATAFVGCDNGHCCGCYGPVGGTKNYCTKDCQSLNGGTITKRVLTWFWVRSTLPKRVWEKCMDYKVLKDNGKFVWYKLLGGSGTPIKGRCSKNNVHLYDGIVVVPDSSTARNIPWIAGLLAYHKDSKQLYIRANNTWKVIAQEKKVLTETMKMVKPNLDKIEKMLENQNKNTMAKLSQLEKQLKDLNRTSRVMSAIPTYPECFQYSYLKEANRNEKDTSGTVLCDGSLSTGWYRFGGQAGLRIATTCVPENRCGTDASGWMNGAHPTVSEGKVTRTVCYHWSSNCCNWSNNIEVLNCGAYYIYKLRSPPVCSLRYCGSNS